MNCFQNTDGIGELCQQATPITVKTGMFLTKPDFQFDTIEDFLTEADWIAAIAVGEVFPVQNIREQEAQDMEDAVIETSTGDKVFQFEGTRGGLLKFILPLDMHKIIKNQYGLKNWRVFWVDKNGNIIGTSPNGVTVKGFKLSYFRVLKQETPSADGAAFTSVEYQLGSIKEWDEKGVYANPVWLASDLSGVLKIQAVVSTVAANIFTVTAAWLSSSEADPNTETMKTFPISALTAGNFKIINQSAAVLDGLATPTPDFTVTESVATPGVYTINATVGGITSGSVQIVASAANLYKSDVKTLVAAA